MTIERVGLPDPISRFNKTEKNLKSSKSDNTDSVQVSDDAKSKAEIYNTTEAAKLTPDVRAEKIEEVKRKLQDPNYISQKVLEEVAEKIMEYLDI